MKNQMGSKPMRSRPECCCQQALLPRRQLTNEFVETVLVPIPGNTVSGVKARLYRRRKRGRPQYFYICGAVEMPELTT